MDKISRQCGLKKLFVWAAGTAVTRYKRFITILCLITFRKLVTLLTYMHRTRHDHLREVWSAYHFNSKVMMSTIFLWLPYNEVYYVHVQYGCWKKRKMQWTNRPLLTRTMANEAYKVKSTEALICTLSHYNSKNVGRSPSWIMQNYAITWPVIDGLGQAVTWKCTTFQIMASKFKREVAAILGVVLMLATI